MDRSVATSAVRRERPTTAARSIDRARAPQVVSVRRAEVPTLAAKIAQLLLGSGADGADDGDAAEHGLRRLEAGISS